MQPETWAQIKRLRQLENLSLAEIARRVRMDRKTVRRALQKESLYPKEPQKPKPSKLDPFKGYIQERLKEYPDLAGALIFEELKKQGYTGKIRILTEYLYGIRPKAKEVFLRIETAPAEQMQVDWANCGTIAIGQTIRKLSAFVAVLSYSRLLYVRFTLSQCLEDFIAAHISAFRHFGGVSRKILYDNLKLVVLSRLGTDVRFNPKFLEFAGIFGFEPVLCNVRRGNEKGKVENGIRYLRSSFLAGRKIASIKSLQEDVELWLSEVANARAHRTTLERPLDRWEKEIPLLGSMPCRDYDASIIKAVRSTHQALIRFDGNAYSVPTEFAYKNLALKATPEEIRFFFETKEIALHRRSFDRGAVIEDPKHLEGLLALKRKARAARLEKGFLELGEAAKEFQKGLVAEGAHPARHIAKIMELIAAYGRVEVLTALNAALKCKAYGAPYVQNIILQKRAARGLREEPPLIIHQKPSWNEIATGEPDLSVYDKLIEEDQNNAPQEK